jgi:hypothetical protein
VSELAFTMGTRSIEHALNAFDDMYLFEAT